MTGIFHLIPLNCSSNGNAVNENIKFSFLDGYNRCQIYLLFTANLNDG